MRGESEKQRDGQEVVEGDCREAMAAMEAETATAIVTDPPYGLKFMGKAWDHGVPGVPFWAEALRVAKPGAMLMAFGGTRTFHRLAVAIEDAGWEIRDTLCWMYGSGFPKSLDIGKAIDKAAGAEREVLGKRTDGRYAHGFSESAKKAMGDVVHAESQGFSGEMGTITAPATEEAERWEGYGTALKPAWEPILLAMKPTDGTYAHNALAHDVAGLNIDGARIGVDRARERQYDQEAGSGVTGSGERGSAFGLSEHPRNDSWLDAGRWPANVILSHTPECRCTGVKKVKATGGAGPREAGRAIEPGGAERGTENGGERFNKADADGTETVEEWECATDCPVRMLDEQGGERLTGGTPTRRNSDKFRTTCGRFPGTEENPPGIGPSSGGASRFFYAAKASREERERGLRGRLPCLTCGQIESESHVDDDGRVGACRRNGHPTVKPLGIMHYLLRLVTMPTHNLILDPFAGSGSTLVAARELCLPAVGIEQDTVSVQIALARLAGTPRPLFPT